MTGEKKLISVSLEDIGKQSIVVLRYDDLVVFSFRTSVFSFSIHFDTKYKFVCNLCRLQRRHCGLWDPINSFP